MAGEAGDIAGLLNLTYRAEHMKLPYIELYHWSIKVTIAYSDEHWLSKVSHITYCLILLIGDARDWI